MSKKVPTTLGRIPYEAVKAAVSLEMYLHDQGVEVRGNRARCIVHGGDNPQSFAVYPEDRRWWCFKCNQGGDVIDLCQALEGGELWEAMITLAMRYGVDLPDRGGRWCSWQDEKGKRRRTIRDALAESYRRRFFRAFCSEYLQSVEPEIRASEAERLWGDLYPLGVACAEQRLSARMAA